MAVATTIYIKSAVWNSVTYDSSAGGPVMAEFGHVGEPLEDRTSDNEYAPFLAVVNKRGIMRLRVREVKQIIALGTKSSMVFTLETKVGGSTITITGANMVLIAIEPGEQSRAQAGSCTLVFQYESADGVTVPFS